MTNNNHNIAKCGYGERLVSYLYGETSRSEKAAFEKHLRTCSSCGDELAAFSGVAYSLNDWKLNDFAGLKTPVIEIPYQETPKRPAIIPSGNSWLTGIIDFLSLNRSRSLATASLAFLAVSLGTVLYSLNYGSGADVAGQPKNSKVITATPTVEKSPAQISPNDIRNDSPADDIKPVRQPKAPPTELAVTKETKNESATKTTVDKERSTPKAETKAPQNDAGKRNDKNKNEVPPKIFVDEDEDDSLRLAELFEEIDAKD